MKYSPFYRRRSLSSFSLACIASFVIVASPRSVYSQTTLPAATPAESPAPSPIAFPLSPELCHPQAVIQISAPATTPTANKTSSSTVSSNIHTANAGIPARITLDVMTPDAFAITRITTLASVVTITLKYNPACAGATTIVAPLDGGTINGTDGAKQLTVGSDGGLTFTFQAPSNLGLYNVQTVLGGCQRTLPFQVAASVDAN